MPRWIRTYLPILGLVLLLAVAGVAYVQAVPPTSESPISVTKIKVETEPVVAIPAEPAAAPATTDEEAGSQVPNAAFVGKDALMNWLNLLLVTGFLVIVFAFMRIRKGVQKRQ